MPSNNTKKKKKKATNDTNSNNKIKLAVDVVAEPFEDIVTGEQSQSLQLLHTLLPIATHLILLTLYLYPICRPQYQDMVFDEFKIYSEKNKHVMNGVTSSNWRELFTSDYWGMDMRRIESNRSWRPMSIASFGFLTTYANLENKEEMVFVQSIASV